MDAEAEAAKARFSTELEVRRRASHPSPTLQFVSGLASPFYVTTLAQAG